ncbi:MAG: thiamine diphosphokinase [Pseudooceanicola sp.]|nr:thiamine diphosphokinase [Pseudooceanicola sp.]
MSDKIVRSGGPVTLIGGGSVGRGDLALALRHAPTLVAADSGAAAALAQGHVPQAVIGDFDSLTQTDKARIPPAHLFPVTEQDSTDFDKALERIGAPLVLGVGFLGARIDHQLAAFSTLMRCRGQPCVLIGPGELVFHLPPRVTFDARAGDVISLFPLVRVTGRSTGLHWPIDGLVLEPGGRIGTSNRATGPVTIETDAPGLLAIVPRDRLEGVAAALRFPPDAAPPR